MHAIQARGSHRDRLSTNWAPAQRQAKLLPREDLFVVLGVMGDRFKDLRDRALLLIGFPGGLRRYELLAVDYKDVERVREEIILTIPRSKADQDGVGRKIGVPFGRTVHCPVQGARNLAQRGSYRTRPCLSSRRSTRTGFSRSPLRRGSLFDRPETPGCGRTRSSELFRSEPAGRIRDQCSPRRRFPALRSQVADQVHGGAGAVCADMAHRRRQVAQQRLCVTQRRLQRRHRRSRAAPPTLLTCCRIQAHRDIGFPAPPPLAQAAPRRPDPS